jgi:hypothetical protein
MVLPDRIELSTSPLPRECSTTELRQRARDKESAQLAPASAAVLATSPPPAQARDRAAARKNIARAEIRPIRGAWFHAPTRERDFAGSSAIVPKTWGSTSPIDRCMALSAWSIVMRLWQVRKTGPACRMRRTSRSGRPRSPRASRDSIASSLRCVKTSSGGNHRRAGAAVLHLPNRPKAD